MTKASLGDYGTYDDAAHSELWRGRMLSVAPELGVTGSRIIDYSVYNHWSTTQGGGFTQELNGGVNVLRSASGNNGVYYTTAGAAMAGMSRWSAAFWAASSAFAANQEAFSFSPNTFVGADHISFYPYDTSGGNGIRIYWGGGSVVDLNDGTPDADGKLNHFALVSRSATEHEVYVNGKLKTTFTDSRTITTNVTRLYLSTSVYGGSITGDIAGMAFFNRALSLDEVQTLSRYPGIDYERRRRRRWYTVPAGGTPVSLTAGAGAGTGSGHAPTPMAGVQPGAGAGAGTGAGGQPSLSIGSIIAGGAGSGAGAGHAPNLNVGGAVLLSAGLGTGTGAGKQPTLILGSVLSPGRGTGTGAGAQPSLELGAFISLFAGVGTGSGKQPTLTTGATATGTRRTGLFLAGGLFV